MEAAEFSENFLDLKLLKYELVISSIATLGCGFLLFILCLTWQKPIRDNILYAVKNAISDSDYAQVSIIFYQLNQKLILPYENLFFNIRLLILKGN